MGTRLCFYRKHRDSPIVPPGIPSHPDYDSDPAPRARWDCDILEEEGIQKFQTMVEEIKQGCAGL